MAVKTITAKLLGNAMAQMGNAGVKPVAYDSDTETLFVNSWSVGHAAVAITRAHTTLVNSYGFTGHTTEWTVKRLTVKIVKGVADPTHVGSIINIDISTKF